MLYQNRGPYRFFRQDGSNGYFPAPTESGGSCTVQVKQTMESPILKSNSDYGAAIKQVGNELFIGETGAKGSIFATGKVHYYTRADDESSWVYQSGFLPPLQSSGGAFGSAIDYDGTRVAVGQSNVAKRCNVFTFTSGVATIEQAIVANTYTDSSSRFGRGLALVGSHVLIGAPGQDLTLSDQGGIEYWSESGGTWTFQQAFTMNATAVSSAGFGAAVAMIDDSTAYCGFADGSDYVIEKWNRSGSTWTYDSTITLTDYQVATSPFSPMSTDGTNLILGFPSTDDGNNDDNYGAFVVINLDGDELFYQLGDAIGDQLGLGVTIDGGEAVVGRPHADPSSTSNAGEADSWDICI